MAAMVRECVTYENGETRQNLKKVVVTKNSFTRGGGGILKVLEISPEHQQVPSHGYADIQSSYLVMAADLRMRGNTAGEWGGCGLSCFRKNFSYLNFRIEGVKKFISVG
jgi:hypothetical protein